MESFVESLAQGHIFIIVIILTGLISLVLLLIALLKTRADSKNSKRDVRSWLNISRIFIFFPAILGFLWRWRAMSNFKKAIQLTGVKINPQLLAQVKYEALLPLKFGVVISIVLFILFLITFFRMQQLTE